MSQYESVRNHVKIVGTPGVKPADYTGLTVDYYFSYMVFFFFYLPTAKYFRGARRMGRKSQIIPIGTTGLRAGHDDPTVSHGARCPVI